MYCGAKVGGMKRLQDWLVGAGITQRELASDLGVTEGAISQWLSGGARPTILNLTKIAARTGLPIADLIEDLTRAA